MIEPTYSLCGLWAFTHFHGYVTAITHLPSMTTTHAEMALTTAQKAATEGTLVGLLWDDDELCQACSQPHLDHKRYYFCQRCMDVARTASTQGRNHD